MNRYGARAQQHWQQHLPKRYAALTEPETFFQQLGEEISTRIQELEEGYRLPSTSDYLKNLQQLTWARHQAEHDALVELALLPAEDDEDA